MTSEQDTPRPPPARDNFNTARTEETNGYGHQRYGRNARNSGARWVGEQHVREDLGFIPSFADWVKAIRPEPWMGRAQRLDDRKPDCLNGTSWQIPLASLQLEISTTGGVQSTSKPQGMGVAA
jgi:hypothetical protein